MGKNIIEKLLILVSDQNIKEILKYAPNEIQVEIINPQKIPSIVPFVIIFDYGPFFEDENWVRNACRQKKWNSPIFILDDKFNPIHSREAWEFPNVFGYLTKKDFEEINVFINERISKHQPTQIKQMDLIKIGSFVKIKKENYRDHNLVSLFVGRMREFMVSLKLLCDAARPKDLGENYFKKLPDILKVLEYIRANRQKKEQFKYLSEFIRAADYENENQGSIKDIKFFQECHPATQSRGVILILGESGTGKSIIAQFIHDYIYKNIAIGDEKKGELITQFCTSIGKDLFESQLFGCLEGAFTDATPQAGSILQAYNGTLFLDEIGDLSLTHQSRLLQYLQDGLVSPMGWVGPPIYVPTVVVAATNRDLKEMVDQKEFREDLYHRLGVYVEIPPLEKRKEEIFRLVDFVLQNPLINPDFAVKNYEKAILEYLRKEVNYKGGNFRLLEQLLRWAVVLARQDGLDVLTLAHVTSAAQGRLHQNKKEEGK